MKKSLRPECGPAPLGTPSVPRDTAIFLLRDALAREQGLIYGRLHDGRGNHCALGAYWERNPNTALDWDLIEEVAAVNDSLGPNACAKDRWKKVNEWIRFKIRAMTVAQKDGSQRAGGARR